MPNPQPGGPGLHICDPRRRWPSRTPRHWVPILVTFDDTRELRWDCPHSLVTTRRKPSLATLNSICNVPK
jgi:hypothetical protein